MTVAKYEERTSKRIGKYRDHMAFDCSYISTDKALKKHLDARVYVTNRRGTYGYQFACVIWLDGTAFAGDISGGCGYDKKGYAVASALREMRDRGTWHASSIEGLNKCISLADGGQVHEALALLANDFKSLQREPEYANSFDWDKINSIMVYAHG